MLQQTWSCFGKTVFLCNASTVSNNLLAFIADDFWNLFHINGLDKVSCLFQRFIG